MSEPIMTREEVAEYLGIKPESVRSALRNYGIKEQRGYLRSEIESLQRKGRGYRSDLHEGHTMTTEATTTHTWKLDTRDDRPWTEWRWLCGCGSRGRWQSQHPSCASYAWAKHAGVDPFEVDEWGRATDDEPPMTDGSEDTFNDTCAWCGAPPRQKCSRDCTGPGQPLRSWPTTWTRTEEPDDE